MHRFMYSALALSTLALAACGSAPADFQTATDSEPLTLTAKVNSVANSPIEEVQMQIAYASREAGLTETINSENYDDMMGLN